VISLWSLLHIVGYCREWDGHLRAGFGPNFEKPFGPNADSKCGGY